MRTKWTPKDVEVTNKFGATLFKFQVCLLAIWPAIQFSPSHEYAATVLEGRHIDWRLGQTKKTANAYNYQLNPLVEDE